MAWADLTDTRCYYDLDGEGEVLLLIPGLGATSKSWDPIVPDLAAKYSVIRLDNRGVGLSRSKRPFTTLHHLAADVIELLDHLQVARAHVMGMSLGGIIAQRLAMDHPNRINRMVLMSCTHRFGPYLHEVAMLIGHALRRFPRRLFEHTMQLLGGSPMYIDADPDRINRKVAEAMQRKISRAAVAQQLRCLAASEPTEDEYKIKVPTLVIAGEFDWLIPHCYAEAMARQIPDCRYILVQGAGHNPLNECPEKVLPAILEFLSAKERKSKSSASDSDTDYQAA